MGQIIGGCLIVALIAFAWEKAVFKHQVDDPVSGKIYSVIASWLTCSMLGGFGLANGRGFYFGAFLLYGISAAIVAVFFYRSGLKLRESNEYETYRD